MAQDDHAAPSAVSVDGRHFACDVSVDRLNLGVGGYVVVEDGSTGARLGHVTHIALNQGDRRSARVEGRVLEGIGAPFSDAAVRNAGPEEVGRWLD